MKFDIGNPVWALLDQRPRTGVVGGELPDEAGYFVHLDDGTHVWLEGILLQPRADRPGERRN